MIKFRLKCKCRDCGFCFYVPIDKSMFEKVTLATTQQVPVITETYSHFCNLEDGKIIGVGNVVAIETEIKTVKEINNINQ